MKHSLPNTLHGLLSVAIADAKAISRRLYTPHFCFWHRPQENGRCQVCLGGSILAHRLGFQRRSHISFSSLSTVMQNKIESINAMRRGCWNYAFELLYRRKPDPSTVARLNSLPFPAEGDFIGWRQFNAHVRSLERIVPRLRAIEELDRPPHPTP